MTYTDRPCKHRALWVIPITLMLLVVISGASVLAGQLVVTSLPYTVNQSSHSASTWDTVTIQGTRLTSRTNGISFAASSHHWLLLLANDTIVFGTDSTYRPSVYTGSHGVDIGSNGHDITIKGGYILHQPANVTSDETVFRIQDTVNAYNLCIDGGYGTYNLLIDSVKEARVRGYNSHVMSGGQKMITVRASRFFNDCYAYTSRELFMACCIKIDGNAADLTTGEFHYRILNSYLEDNAHAAVYASGSTSSTYCVVQMDGDTVKVDSRNRRYTTYQGTGASNVNAYGIQFTYGGAGSYIKNCVITSGTRYHGGRGIQFVRAKGTQTNPIEIAYNRVDVHEGLNVEFGTLYYGCAVKIRQNSIGVWLHHNAIIYTADTTQTVGRAYQPKGEALMYQMGFDAGGAYSGPYYITMENNACSTKVLTNVNDPDYELSTVDFETCEYADNTVIYRNNKMYSSGNHVYNFGQYDGGGSHIRMSGDTVSINQNSAVSPKWTFNPGDYRGAFDNWATDFTYSQSTADTAITHEFQNNITGSGTQNITLRETISIYVKGNNGLPVVNASVSVRNAYNQTVLSGVTNNGGRLSGMVSYWFETRSGTDSTGFSNFTATATSGSNNASHSFAVRWNSFRDTVTLTQVAGTGTWETGGTPTDVTPPNQIQDLGAVPGSSSGTIMLTWTATGDDYNVGYADYYLVRYSTEPIDAANWGAATSAGAPPAPTWPGARQSMTLGGLSPGVVYFAGVVAVDEAGNQSALSNIASAQAKITVVTGGDSANVTIVEPTDYAVIADVRPTLVVLNIDTGLASGYRFQIATDSGFADVVTTSPAVSQQVGLQTSWRVSPALQPHGDYYWRVSVNDGPYGRFAAFTVDVDTRAYPNPFRLAEGNQVTFTGIPAGSNLLLMTTSGDTVRRWAGTNGSDVVWDGRNESGQEVASGMYLWYVESSDLKGKLIVIR